jgi:hypothetical protein
MKEYPPRVLAGPPDGRNPIFPMSDLNNVQIADLLSQYLAEKKLD